MFNKDLPLHSRQHSIKFGDIISGSNVADYSFVMTRIGNFKERANKNLNRALDRLRASTGKLVINAVWLDTIDVRDGEAYYMRMVKFQLQEKTHIESGGIMITDIANYTSGLMQKDVAKWLDMATVRERKDDDGVLVFDYYESGKLLGTRHEGLDVVFTSYGLHRLVQNLVEMLPAMLLEAGHKVGIQ